MVHVSFHKNLLLIALGIALGILFGFNFPAVLNVYVKPIILILFLLLVVLYRTTTRILNYGCIALIAFGLGAFRMQLTQTAVPDLSLHQGIAQIQKKLSSTDFSNSYLIKLVGDQQHYLLTKMSVDTIPLIPGDRIHYWAKAKALHYPTPPGGFNYQRFLNKQGITHELLIMEYEKIEAHYSLTRLAYQFRVTLKAHLEDIFEAPRETSTALALLLGVKDKEFKSLQNTYAKAGVAHLLAISGLHTAIYFSLFYLLFYPVALVPKGKRIQWLSALLCLWGFALVSGWSHSVVRASLLLSFLVVSKLVQRSNTSLHFLILAFLCNLLIDPYALLQIGFQMSYTAVFFILWWHPILRSKLKHSQKFIDKLLNVISVSLAAQIGVLPLSLYYFGSLPLHFLIGNILIVPLMGIVIYSGVTSSIITYFSSYFEKLIYGMNELIEGLTIEGANLSFSIDEIQLLLLYLFLCILMIAYQRKSYIYLQLALLFLVGFQTYRIYIVTQLLHEEVLFIFGTYQNTAILYKKGPSLQYYSNDSIPKQQLDEISRYYHTKSIKHYPLALAYQINTYKFILINEAIYPKTNTNLVLISQNPKLHFERLIDSINPKLIVVDKQTAPWNVKRWKTTAEAKKIPLIDLRKVGYFKINL